MPTSIDQLSPRQRECLRLVYQRKTSKEIARLLGIQPGTVATYISEAVAVLGAANRRDAAERLHEAEIGTPANMGPDSAGLEPIPAPDPTPAPTGRRSHPLGPLAPANRDADNDQSITTRLAWILILAIGIAIGFGSLAAAVRTFSDFVRPGNVQRAP